MPYYWTFIVGSFLLSLSVVSASDCIAAKKEWFRLRYGTAAETLNTPNNLDPVDDDVCPVESGTLSCCSADIENDMVVLSRHQLGQKLEPLSRLAKQMNNDSTALTGRRGQLGQLVDNFFAQLRYNIVGLIVRSKGGGQVGGGSRSRRSAPGNDALLVKCLSDRVALHQPFDNVDIRLRARLLEAYPPARMLANVLALGGDQLTRLVSQLSTRRECSIGLARFQYCAVCAGQQLSSVCQDSCSRLLSHCLPEELTTSSGNRLSDVWAKLSAAIGSATARLEHSFNFPAVNRQLQMEISEAITSLQSRYAETKSKFEAECRRSSPLSRSSPSSSNFSPSSSMNGAGASNNQQFPKPYNSPQSGGDQWPHNWNSPPRRSKRSIGNDQWNYAHDGDDSFNQPPYNNRVGGYRHQQPQWNNDPSFGAPSPSHSAAATSHGTTNNNDGDPVDRFAVWTGRLKRNYANVHNLLPSSSSSSFCPSSAESNSSSNSNQGCWQPPDLDNNQPDPVLQEISSKLETAAETLRQVSSDLPGASGQQSSDSGNGKLIDPDVFVLPGGSEPLPALSDYSAAARDGGSQLNRHPIDQVGSQWPPPAQQQGYNDVLSSFPGDDQIGDYYDYDDDSPASYDSNFDSMPPPDNYQPSQSINPTHNNFDDIGGQGGAPTTYNTGPDQHSLSGQQRPPQAADSQASRQPGAPFYDQGGWEQHQPNRESSWNRQDPAPSPHEQNYETGFGGSPDDYYDSYYDEYYSEPTTTGESANPPPPYFNGPPPPNQLSSTSRAPFGSPTGDDQDENKQRGNSSIPIDTSLLTDPVVPIGTTTRTIATEEEHSTTTSTVAVSSTPTMIVDELTTASIPIDNEQRSELTRTTTIQPPIDSFPQTTLSSPISHYVEDPFGPLPHPPSSQQFDPNRRSHVPPPRREDWMNPITTLPPPPPNHWDQNEPYQPNQPQPEYNWPTYDQEESYYDGESNIDPVGVAGPAEVDPDRRIENQEQQPDPNSFGNTYSEFSQWSHTGPEQNSLEEDYPDYDLYTYEGGGGYDTQDYSDGGYETGHQFGGGDSNQGHQYPPISQPTKPELETPHLPPLTDDYSTPNDINLAYPPPPPEIWIPAEFSGRRDKSGPSILVVQRYDVPGPSYEPLVPSNGSPPLDCQLMTKPLTLTFTALITLYQIIG